MLTLAQLLDRFQTEDACYAYLTKLRWPTGVCCPRCGNANVYKLAKPHRWICKICQKNCYRFSPLVGTIFENTNIPLRTWFQTILLMCQSKKGMSAMQIQRTLGLGSYRSAWYMCHRIRAAMDNQDFTKLMGEIEVDETYVGGKPENRHRSERKRRAGTRTKVPVVAAISRKGKVVARVIEHADIKTLDGFVNEVVNSENVSLISTDEHWGYSRLAAHGYPHKTVKHRAGEYARGVVHTANLDSFWSLLKRGIMGSYHQVSKKYLPFYLAEFTFRHNHRKDTDLFASVLAAC
jgi:transposase-like protein